ncbi:arylamine N-acetyltransferase 2 [Polychaeton citri CBS 116435]|uniref:Arylamine N-acetyltransferase 2 n=1 Tax=Polychaeton citri CBS 116435 TaxID=1314669 RepID=A0A9P4QF45_9PEZI|nr:arylamine N-acetyltransferase 2 [Polychaeton citri CBS 116435]
MGSVYSADQVEQFLSYVELPPKYHLHNNPPRDLTFLTALHTHMISKVPYENLTIHYSNNHAVSLELQTLFQKIVGDARGRGGYCMEVSLLYNQILRALGFRAFTVGVKIRLRTDGIPQGDFFGWVHIVNIVTLEDNTRWMVDVGFGGDGATKPLPLTDGHITQNIGTQEIRLIRDFIPTQTERTPGREMWIYQYRNESSKPWNSFYAFSDLLEFLPPDFHIMNWFTSTSPENAQTFTTLVVKFLRRPRKDALDDEEIYGKRMLVNGTVKENLGGRTQVVQECTTEEERVKALKTWFDLELTQEEIASIRGRNTELKC